MTFSVRCEDCEVDFEAEGYVEGVDPDGFPSVVFDDSEAMTPHLQHDFSLLYQ